MKPKSKPLHKNHEIIEKTNEVHKLIIQKNVLNWNKKFEDFSGRFRVNPYSLTTVTSKPNHINPLHGVEHYKASIYRDPTEEAFSSDFLARTVSRGAMPPNLKHKNPQTTAQEIGWMPSPVLPRAQSRWSHRGKNTCFETFFAEEYIKFKGINPYFTRKSKIN
jgi:hypothetical protein